MASKKIISITIDSTILDEVNDLAAINCRTRSNMIESALREWLRQFEQEEPEPEFFEGEEV